MDPFDTLNLPATFELSPADIDAAFFARMAVAHPDLAAGDADALDRSAQLNDAKAVLLDPEQRANALLARRGGPSKEQDKSLPPAFLMEVMDAREGLEAARASGDAAELARWHAWADQQRAVSSAEVAALFAQPDTEPTRRRIRTVLNAWRYIERMIEALDPGTSGKPAL